MTGHGIAVIEMTIFCGIQFYHPAFFEAKRKLASRGHTLYGCQFAIGNPDLFVRSRELHAIACRERLLSFLVDADSTQSLGIIGDWGSAMPGDGQEILFGVNRYHAGVAGCWDAQNFAAARIAQNVIHVVKGSPTTLS